mmetsp:Transcript_79590/g.140484  ORF Transcript_79590/g.140484 Transcript_79590/m.140484 type:complete len:220 (+) Transcript_79590:672-1331(+)
MEVEVPGTRNVTFRCREIIVIKNASTWGECEDVVHEDSTCSIAELDEHVILVLACSLLRAGPEDGGLTHCRLCPWSDCACIFGAIVVAIDLIGVIAQVHSLGHEEILNVSLVAAVNVQLVITIVEERHIGDINGATEELKSIIKIVSHLNVRDGSAFADAGQSDPVDLVVCRKLRSSKPYTNICHDTTVVIIISATVAVVTQRIVDALDVRNSVPVDSV